MFLFVRVDVNNICEKYFSRFCPHPPTPLLGQYIFGLQAYPCPGRRSKQEIIGIGIPHTIRASRITCRKISGLKEGIFAVSIVASIHFGHFLTTRFGLSPNCGNLFSKRLATLFRIHWQLISDLCNFCQKYAQSIYLD